MKEQSSLSPEPVQRAISMLDSVITRLAQILRTAEVGHYESDVMAKEYLVLIIRNVEAVLVLAHSHWVYYPGAMNMARSAFETSIRTLWLLDPDDPMEREARWLGFLQEEDNYYDFMSTQLMKINDLDLSAEFSKKRDSLRRFRLQVTEKLPGHVERIDRLPKLWRMLTTLKAERKNLAYTIASQFTHGTGVATKLYHRGYGTEKQFGENVTASDWQGCLQLCFYSLFAPGLKFVERCGVDKDAFLSDALGAEVQRAINSVTESFE